MNTNNFFNIVDSGATGDSYNFVKSWTGYVEDKGGNDKYTVNNLAFKSYNAPDGNYAGITIEDNGGKGDSLNLKGTNKNNLVFMSDFTKYGENDYRATDNSLIIYDKSTQGFVKINNFYSTDANHDFNGFDKGLIETISAKVGNKYKALDVTKKSEYYLNLNAIKQQVTDWVLTQGNGGIDFNGIEDVLTSGSAEQKATLTSYFDGTHGQA